MNSGVVTTSGGFWAGFLLWWIKRLDCFRDGGVALLETSETILDFSLSLCSWGMIQLKIFSFSYGLKMASMQVEMERN